MLSSNKKLILTYSIAPSVVLLVSLVAMAIQVGVCYPKLPDQIFVHFTGGFRPDNTGSKKSFLVLEIGLCFGLPLMFILMTLGIGSLAYKGGHCMNLPYKRYWLRPDKVDSTVAFLTAFMMWNAALTNCLLLVQWQLVYSYNLQLPNNTAMYSVIMWLSVIAYLVATLVLSGLLLAKFYRPPQNESDDERLVA